MDSQKRHISKRLEALGLTDATVDSAAAPLVERLLAELDRHAAESATLRSTANDHAQSAEAAGYQVGTQRRGQESLHRRRWSSYAPPPTNRPPVRPPSATSPRSRWMCCVGRWAA